LVKQVRTRISRIVPTRKPPSHNRRWVAGAVAASAAIAAAAMTVSWRRSRSLVEAQR
jgi:hypothetical protein